MQHKVGIIGGMSWESTASYYRLINKSISEKCGGLHSADLLIHSLDFASIGQLQHEGNWDALSSVMTDSAQTLERAGAKAIAIATNTMHKVADDVAASVGIPLLHIGDAVANTCREGRCEQAGLLGTRFTMAEPFYRERLASSGLKVLVPDSDEQESVHRIIYSELCKGIIDDASRRRFLEIINSLATRGAQGIILGCTEIGLLVSERDTAIPLYDTTSIHAAAITRFLLEGEASLQK